MDREKILFLNAVSNAIQAKNWLNLTLRYEIAETAWEYWQETKDR